MVKISYSILYIFATFNIFARSCKIAEKVFLAEKISDNFDFEFIVNFEDTENIYFGDTIQISVIIKNKTDSTRKINISAPLYISHNYGGLFVHVDTHERISYEIVPMGLSPNYVSIAENDIYMCQYAIRISDVFFYRGENKIQLHMIFGKGNSMFSNTIQLFVEK